MVIDPQNAYLNLTKKDFKNKKDQIMYQHQNNGNGGNSTTAFI